MSVILPFRIFNFINAVLWVTSNVVTREVEKESLGAKETRNRLSKKNRQHLAGAVLYSISLVFFFSPG